MSAVQALVFICFSLIPIFITIVIHCTIKFIDPILEEKISFFKKISKTPKMVYWRQQIVIGVLFTGAAILSMGFGVEVRVPGIDNPVLVTTSTAVPVIAGLMFGLPAGTITSVLAGCIRFAFGLGGVSAPTILSLFIGGPIAGLIKHFWFKGGTPKWYFAALVGIFIETINILLIFIFNLNHISDAFNMLSRFDFACIMCNGFACGITALFIGLIEGERIFYGRKEHRIAYRTQTTLFFLSVVALGITSIVTYIVCYEKAKETFYETLSLNMDDMDKDIIGLNLAHEENYVFGLPLRHFVSEGGFSLVIAANENCRPYPYDQSYPLPANPPEVNQICGIGIKQLPDEEEEKEVVFNYNDDFKFDDGTFIYAHPASEFSEEGRVDHVFTESCKGTTYLCSYTEYQFVNGENIDELGAYYIVVMIPKAEMRTEASLAFRVTLQVETLVFIALFGLINYFVKNKIVRPIEKMDNSLERIIDGNLNEQLEISGFKEFEQLSNNINLTVGALKNYGEEIQHRMEDELEFARAIQRNSVPNVFPSEPEYNIYASMEPAREIGGDFYDCFKMNNGRIMFLIADVSGKGIPAALFMMKARTLIKSLSLTDCPIDDLVNQTNKYLCADNDSGIFVTAWIGILDPKTGELHYINAGHTDPLLKRDGKFSIFKNKHNIVLAAIKDYSYHYETLYMQPGDELFLYTDGVNEAVDKDKKAYGLNRLVDTCNNSKYFTSKQLITDVTDDVAKFVNGEEQFDDITALCFRYLGKREETSDNVLTLKAIPPNASVAINYVESVLGREDLEISPSFVARMSIVVDELFANVTYHAYPKGFNGEMTIKVDIKDGVLYLTTEDSGTPFDPTIPFKADTTSKIEDRKQGGLGIFLIRRSVDKMEYEYKDHKNILHLEKKIPPAPPKKEDN